MFGESDYSFTYDSEEVSIRIDPSDGFYQYVRKSGTEAITKVISGGSRKIVVNPVEPVNLPREVTRFLEIHFTPVAIEPDSGETVYVTFPVEIGIFLESKGDFDVLDIFTLSRPKYSLYGPPEEGVITRYHKSAVSGTIPKLDRLKEGVIALSITNASRNWVEVSRVVFDCSSFFLYYGDIVSVVARMNILSRDIADVRSEDRPLGEGMVPSILVNKARKTLIPDKIPFTMEFGVGD
ncbi:MAG: DUF432 domain-containing protein [Methanomicrobiales archaeon]|nr:DUF432 domain-containing protein [Methanomicrobiales archaeon]NYT21528.1 DUF432 domain-containing protein [Methanomicrobiales archaeon]